jgi:hypothetical protein
VAARVFITYNLSLPWEELAIKITCVGVRQESCLMQRRHRNIGAAFSGTGGLGVVFCVGAFFGCNNLVGVGIIESLGMAGRESLGSSLSSDIILDLFRTVSCGGKARIGAGFR